MKKLTLAVGLMVLWIPWLTQRVSAQHFNDVWERPLAGGAWNQLSPPPGPAPRRHSPHALDTFRNRLIIAGGASTVTLFDAWALTLNTPGAETWTQLPNIPHAASFRAAIYDSLRDRFVPLVPHLGHIHYLHLGTNTWSSFPITGVSLEPTVFTTHSAVYDAANDRYLLFGGGLSLPTNADRVRVLDPNTNVVSDLGVGATKPAARALAGCVYDPFAQRMLLFGGGPGTGQGCITPRPVSLNDTWQLSLTPGSETWSQFTPANAPLDRTQHAVAFDTLRGHFLIFGGLKYRVPDACSSLCYFALNDSWAFDGISWLKLSSTGPIPATRRGASAVYDAVNDRLVLFGGEHLTGSIVVEVAEPTDLVATFISSAQVDLTWTDNATNEQNYRIERSCDGGASQVIAILAADSTSYSDTSAPAGFGSCSYVVYAVHACGDSAASATVTVTSEGADTTPPEIISCGDDQQASADTQCQVQVPDFTAGVIATDNTTPTHELVITQALPAGTLVGLGSTSVTITVQDAAGNDSTCERIFTVSDTTPPQIACPADTQLECPADTSAASTGEATASDNCSLASIGSEDSFLGRCGQAGTLTRTWTATDGAGLTASCVQTITVVDTTAPVIASFNGSPLLAQVNQTVSLTASFTDDCGSPHTAIWDFGDTSGQTTSPATSPLSAAHAYADAGIYTVQLTVTDDCGNSASDSLVVVVYDPAAGFTTGGGWFVPDAESFIDGQLVTDTVSRANFGFVVKYKAGASTPSGQLEFIYKAGDIDLHSSGMEWLVVQSTTKVRFKGEATINGEGPYAFKVTAEDLGEPGTSDTFQIEIWLGAGVDTENAPPTPKHKAKGVLGGGNIKIHTQ